MSLTPRGMSIQEAYRLYSDKRLTVNRRYQRKLVWTEKEKKHLIDSVQKELPIPLFMLAKLEGDDDRFEIIDGMQRMNAIFSFIEHQFVDENEKCFDLEQSNRAKLIRDSGVFIEFIEDVERLSPEDCAKLLEYQMAVTIDTDSDEARINDVFGRINSGGRQLSPQEQRQAGLVSNFSEFVRKLAFELRGDSSPDILLLNNMPEVSFDTPREKQRYGIDAAEVFWCKHAITTANELARSADEQIIADLAISMLNNTPLNASREVFDAYFELGSPEFNAIHAALATYGAERLKAEIIATIGAIRTVFEADGFYSFRDCVQKTRRNSARTSFFAAFCAFHDLMFKNGMFPNDNPAIRNAFENVQKHMIRSAHHSTTEDRLRNIAVVRGLIQGSFVKKDVAAFGSAHGLVIDLENSLRRSQHEASLYEFKIGICSLGAKPALDEGMYAKIGRTACAIANTHPGQDGYLYIGVADKKSDADRVNNLFKVEPIEIGKVFFVGMGHDLKILNIDLEQYVKQMILRISELPIAETLRTQIINIIDHAEYRGRPFIRLRVPAQAELSAYDGDYPVRRNSETVNLSTTEALSQAKLFTEK